MPNRRLGRIASARLGVLGGTFDPIHVGHLVVAVNVRAALGLDRTLLVVANVPWQKTGSREITKAEDRLALVEAAVAGIDGLEASRIEIDRGGPSYMVDTLTELDGREPGAELFLVIGSDVAGDLATWERVDDMRSLCTLVIVNRPGVDDGSITHRRGPLPPGDLGGWRVERDRKSVV